MANGTRIRACRPACGRGDLSRAHRMVRAVRAGVVHVNTYGGSDMTVPLGGVKQSRATGTTSRCTPLDKYVDLKTAWIQL
jgi:gamma-glutamyl-gamma-aminobutyraldehyde dehydrogenase